MLFSLHCLSFYQVGLAPFDPITTFSDKQCQFERWNTDTRWEPQIIFHKDFASPGMLSFQTIMPAGAGYTKDDEVKNIPGFFLVPDNGHAIFKGSFSLFSCRTCGCSHTTMFPPFATTFQHNHWLYQVLE